MATFTDGCTIAQASPPSMKLPISLALDWPHRVPGAQPSLDFSQSHDWRFEPLDDVAFLAVQLARQAAAFAARTQPCTTPPMRRLPQPSCLAAFISQKSLMWLGRC